MAQIRVAVEDASGGGGGQDTVDQLNNDTFFDFTATLVNAAAIDTVAELQAYDCVVVGGTGSNNADWTAAMWTAVRIWVQTGGGIVATGWFNFDVRAGDPGVADLEAIIPTQNVASTNQFVAGSATIDFFGPNHPVTTGLNDFAPGADLIEVNRFAAEADDTVLAAIVGAPGDISVAVKELGAGRSVYLGTLHMAAVATYNTGPLRTGLPDRLLEQAVAWAGAPPTVTSVSPDPVEQLADLTITGTWLNGATAVTIGGVAATIVSNTSTEIVVTVALATPTGAGRVVSVTTPLGVDDTATVEVLDAPGCCGLVGRDPATTNGLALLLLMLLPLAMLGTRRRLA